MEKKVSGYHKIALAALFTVGNALIRYPWRASDQSVLPVFLLSVVGSLIPAFLLYPVFRWVWRKPLSRRRGRRLAVGVLSVLFGAYALYCAFRSCADYVRFSMDLILPMTSNGASIPTGTDEPAAPPASPPEPAPVVVELTPEQKFAQACAVICPIKKHGGKTLGEVLQMDPRAINWLADNYSRDETVVPYFTCLVSSTVVPSSS